MPKLNKAQVLVLFFSSGLLFGVISPWGGVGILFAMVLLEAKSILLREKDYTIPPKQS